MVIDSDVTNYTLSSLFPATEYEISLSAVKESQESDVVRTSVFTGRLSDQSNAMRPVKTHGQTDGCDIDQNVHLIRIYCVTLKIVTLRRVSPSLGIFCTAFYLHCLSSL